MIIKTISRKSNVAQLIRYVLRDEKILLDLNVKSTSRSYVPGVHLTALDVKHLQTEVQDRRISDAIKECGGDIALFMERYMHGRDKLDSVVIKQNVRARTVKGYIRAFEDNELLRVHKRSNNVLAYHHIISLSGKDKAVVTEVMLKDIARQFISLHGSNSLFVGAIHSDKQHLHVHLIQSGTQYMTGIANRVSKLAYNEMVREMQEYQLKKYPELVHSVHGKDKTNGKNIEKEQVVKNIFAERLVMKSSVQEGVADAFAKANSTAHFRSLLAEIGMQPYERGGKLTGVIYGDETKYKFRFSRVGIDLKQLKERDKILEKKEQALEEIRTIRENRAKDRQQEKPQVTETKVIKHLEESENTLADDSWGSETMALGNVEDNQLVEKHTVLSTDKSIEQIRENEKDQNEQEDELER